MVLLIVMTMKKMMKITMRERWAKRGYGGLVCSIIVEYVLVLYNYKQSDWFRSHSRSQRLSTAKKKIRMKHGDMAYSNII